MTGIVVEKIEEGMDRSQVHATTYQMRNPFIQFADAVASELDVHCYFQHARAADLCPKGGRVLDVCCGRGLLIPFLRYRSEPAIYVGVDLCPKNAKWREGADPRRETLKKEWSFPTVFVESDASTMSGPVGEKAPGPFGLVVFTSSIEHMQPEAQQLALVECRKLAKPGAVLYLTCPVRRPGEPEVQYAAHVYEPRPEELEGWLAAAGWRVTQRTGIGSKVGLMKRVLKGPSLKWAEHVLASMPREQALPTIGCLFPDAATEMAWTCVRG